jgi:hypothetical protein
VDSSSKLCEHRQLSVHVRVITVFVRKYFSCLTGLKHFILENDIKADVIDMFLRLLILLVRFCAGTSD